MEKTRVSDIRVEYPEAEELSLQMSLGACRLSVVPDAVDMWVTGLFTSPSGAEARIVRENGRVKISTGRTAGEVVGLISGLPHLDVALGKAKPYMLAVDSAANDSALDLGGLPIRRLEIRQGAGKTTLDFSSPNPRKMDLLKITMGACTLSATNLANARFSEMTLDGGAASYTCDFSGSLMEDAFVKLSTGMSAVEVRVPESTAAKIATEATLGSLDVGDGFTKKEGAFWTPAAVAGSTPLLTIKATVALGTLKIRIV